MSKNCLSPSAGAEQAELESQGKYTEARQALEQQIPEASAQKDQRIAELEARVLRSWR